MTFKDPQIFIETWKKDKNRPPRGKKSKIIKLCILGILAIIIIFIGFYYFSDFINKPAKEISSASSSGNWAMFGWDLTRSGYTGTNLSNLQGNVDTVLDTGSVLIASPVTAAGLIYVGSREGKFYAIDENSGSIRWEFQAGSWIESTAAVVDNTVYFGSNDGFLYALEANSGQKLWSFNTLFRIKSSPAVADDKVYFGGSDFFVYCLEAKTGKLIWKTDTGNSVLSSPVVASGIVCIGSTDGTFLCLDARSGKVRLKAPVKRTIVSAPLVSGETVYFLTVSGELYAMEINAKNWIWEYKLRPLWQTLNLYGVAPAPPRPSGLLWKMQLGEVSGESSPSTYSSPIMVNNSLIAAVDKQLISVNLQNQIRNWVFEAENTISSTPIFLGQSILTVDEGGKAYLLDPATGEKIQDIQVGGKITSQALATKEAIYISSEDGKLYTLK
jgi:outer membrane protein assembly factor BamB